MNVRSYSGMARQLTLLCTLALTAPISPQASATPAGVSPQAQVSQAKLELQQGHVGAAIDLLIKAKQVLGTAPGSCDCHFNLGKALCTQAKLEQQGNANKCASDFLQAKTELRTAIRVGRGNAISKQANEFLMANMPRQYLSPRVGEGTEMILARLGLRGTDRGAGDVSPKAKVFEFYADWCEPCKMLKPVIEKIKQQYGNQVEVTAINVDDKNNAEIVEQYDVSPIPTVIYMNPDGQVMGYSIGYAGEKNVQKELQKIIPANEGNRT